MKGAVQSLPANYSPEDPYKAGKPAALRELGLDDPTKIRVDPAHTWAIAGIGKDLCASSIMMCARMGLFGEGSLKMRLQCGYESFQTFLVQSGKYSSIADFSYKTLKCSQTPLGCPQHQALRCK